MEQIPGLETVKVVRGTTILLADGQLLFWGVYSTSKNENAKIKTPKGKMPMN